MEALAASVVAVLVRVAATEGGKLVQEIGGEAADAAHHLFSYVIDRLRADPDHAPNAERFPQKPAAYQGAVQDAVETTLAADPAFAAQVTALLQAFEKAAPQGAIVNTGSGAIAVGGGVAAGQGGAAAGAGGMAVVGNVADRPGADGGRPGPGSPA